ncbi:MAG: hypothetical protein ACI9E1_001910 [Cryomorphaceae bacterium]|jgi:hypothetical protein
MEIEKENHFQKFIKLINRVAKIAQGLKIAAMVLLVPTLIVFVGGLVYFYSATDLGHWRWGIPCSIMLLPIFCIGIVWWVLDAIASLPEVCEANTEHIKSVVKHHRKTIALAEGKRLSKFKYLTIVGKILYGSTEVIDGVAMATFAATPIFWILYTVTFIGSIALSCIMIIICASHYLFA